MSLSGGKYIHWGYGFHSGYTIGWPNGWLTVSVYDTTQWVNGEKVPGERTTHITDVRWRGLLIAVLVSGAFASLAYIPLLYRLFKQRKHHRTEQIN